MASLSLVSLDEKLLWVNTCHSWVYACTPCVFKVCCKYHLLCLEESVRTRFLYISHYKRLVVLVQQTSKQPSNQITSHPLGRHFEHIQLRLRHVWHADCTHRTGRYVMYILREFRKRKWFSWLFQVTMVVCQYFLKGDCRFGDRCRFEHPSGWLELLFLDVTS